MPVKLFLQVVDLIKQVHDDFDPDGIQTHVFGKAANLAQSRETERIDVGLPFPRCRWHKSNPDISLHLADGESDRFRCKGNSVVFCVNLHTFGRVVTLLVSVAHDDRPPSSRKRCIASRCSGVSEVGRSTCASANNSPR